MQNYYRLQSKKQFTSFYFKIGTILNKKGLIQSLNRLSYVGAVSQLRRINTPNKDIICLTDAYKDMFKTEKLSENLKNLNIKFKKNELVNEVIEFINKDKKRPICTPEIK